MQNTLTIQKIAAALVGVAMIAGATFAFAAQRAHAVTIAELVELFIALDIISEDKADEAREAIDDMDSGSGSTTGGTSASCSFTFTQNLTTGSTGQEVMNLQKFLNLSADTRVAVTGPGSPGMETMYFGPATAAAVSKFQVKYASEILTPLGLTAGTGNFGASSRSKANALCMDGGTGTPATPTAPGDDDDDDDNNDNDDNSSMSDEEASLEDFSALNSPSNEDVQAGDDEVEVYGFEFDVEDGDVEVNRVDVAFQADDADTYSEDPWDYFDEVMLMNEDGDVLATAAADDEDDWDDASGADVTGATGEVYEIRFNDVDDARFDAGDNARMYVAVTLQGSLDSDDEGQTWHVWVPEDGIRATDGAGLDQYTGDESDPIDESKSFDVEEEGEGEELSVSLSSSNPDASTIKVDEDDETDDVAILIFDLEAEDNDIELQTLPIVFTMGGAEFDSVVSDVVIEIDGEVFDDYDTASSTAGSGSTATTTFDIDGDFTVEEGEEVEVRVLVTFNATEEGDNYANGETIMAAVDTDGVEADGADDNVEVSGSATGDEHTLIAEGIFAEPVSTDTDTTGTDELVGVFTIKFDVTAFEDDFYVDEAASSTAATGVTYSVEGGSLTSQSATLSSTADEEDDAFLIREGETETFTLQVNIDPVANGSYRVILDDVRYGTTATAAQTVSGILIHTAAPEEDFRTDYQFIEGVTS